MRSLLLFALLPLAAVALFPPEWRLALALGWALMMAAEIVLHRRRMALMAAEVRGPALLALMSFGFLGRLTLLVLGAVIGAKAELFPEGPFLAACLCAIALGEALSLPQVFRFLQRRPSATLREADQPQD